MRKLSIADALNFVWSLPVSVLITGAENASLMKEKIELVHQFRNLDQGERELLIKRLKHLAEEGKVEYYKRLIQG